MQSPWEGQNWNPYAYVLNNPLSFTDPSGYSFFRKYWRQIVAVVVSYVSYGAASSWASGWAASATVQGAVSGAVSGFVGGAVASGSVKGGVQGAFSGAVLGGIGGHYGGRVTVGRVAASGLAGGVLADLQGGKFGHGFLSAGVAAASGPYVPQDDVVAGATVSAILGGSVSALTGGKFANGAVTAAFSYAMSSVSVSRFSSNEEGVTTEPTPDGAGAKRLRTFYEAMAALDDAGIVLGEGTTVIYRDEYSYMDSEGRQRFCAANCDSVLEGGQIFGQYSSGPNRITLFRGAVEREMTGTSGMVNGVFTFSVRYSTNSGVETAIKVLGHEAAHSRGIDMRLPAAALHPNAEAAGLYALENYRRARVGR